jgi:16S rRNA (adenine1518-N6/adenine1519-N6)-dimethyltransferase
LPKTIAAHPPKRRPKLGQHFLDSPSHALAIIEALGDISASTVLEVGPGGGALTSLLARRARRLIAVEVDRVLAAQLRLQFGMSRNVEILEADILAVDFDSLLGPRPGTTSPGLERAGEAVKVVGNLPYFLTSDILLRLFDNCRHFSLLVLMVQREVADRIAAEPGGREYGLLSATAQLYGRIEKVLNVPRAAFNPPPDVDSAVLRITLQPKFETLGVESQPFIAFLQQSFAQKRKTLWNNLRGNYDEDKLRSALKAAGVTTTARAETLTLEQSAAVFRTLGNTQSD